MKKIYVWFFCFFVMLNTQTACTNQYTDAGAPATNKYTDAGAPAVDRIWGAVDYARFNELLKKGVITLPFFETEIGTSYLNQLTNEDNLLFAKDNKQSDQVRAMQLINMLGRLNDMNKMYLSHAASSKKGGREVIRISAFQLKVSSIASELTHQFISTIPKDEKYEVRMVGYERMKIGLSTLFASVLYYIEDAQVLNDDKVILLKAMTETLPKLKESFSPNVKQEIISRMKRLQQTAPKTQKAFLSTMLEELN